MITNINAYFFLTSWLKDFSEVNKDTQGPMIISYISAAHYNLYFNDLLLISLLKRFDLKIFDLYWVNKKQQYNIFSYKFVDVNLTETNPEHELRKSLLLWRYFKETLQLYDLFLWTPFYSLFQWHQRTDRDPEEHWYLSTAWCCVLDPHPTGTPAVLCSHQGKAEAQVVREARMGSGYWVLGRPRIHFLLPSYRSWMCHWLGKHDNRWKGPIKGVLCDAPPR